jgi:hypothetical protein
MEIIPKQSQRMPEWLNIVFYLSLILLICSVIGFFILNHSLNKAKESLKSINEKIANQTTTERVILEEEVLSQKDKIDSFSLLLDNHFNNSNVFEYFQKLCHPKVSFSQFVLNSRSGTINAAGETQSFITLGQQLMIYQKDPLTKNVDISQITMDRLGRVGFSLILSFNPAILEK